MEFDCIGPLPFHLLVVTSRPSCCFLFECCLTSQSLNNGHFVTSVNLTTLFLGRLVAISWERAVPLAFHVCSFNFSAVLVVHVPFPFDVWGRMLNSIVSVPDHCLFIYGDPL